MKAKIETPIEARFETAFYALCEQLTNIVDFHIGRVPLIVLERAMREYPEGNVAQMLARIWKAELDIPVDTCVIDYAIVLRRVIGPNWLVRYMADAMQHEIEDEFVDRYEEAATYFKSESREFDKRRKEESEAAARWLKRQSRAAAA